LVPKGTPWAEVEQAKREAKINFPNYHFEDRDYKNPHRLETPVSVDSKRVQVVYGDQKLPDGTYGKDRDGLIEIRPGCEDLNLGRNSYAQVRISVDGTHYAKGVAVYGDPKQFPPGVDILVNTSKGRDEPVMGRVLKAMKYDPITNNPFGASINQDDRGESKHPLKYFQAHYIGKDGKEHLSALNIVNEQGTWDEWNRNLSSQFLAKQTIPLAKRQLNLDARMRKLLDEFFGTPVCDGLFGTMNLFASANGLPVWANLLLAVTEEVEGAMQGELTAREKRIAKYTEKYKK
jgi:hypothetical protein